MTNETPPVTLESSTFNVVLRPHRSLGPTGFLVLMTIISVICFSAGLVFYFMGAWPVFGFFGLDVLLIYIAFRLNYRSGRMYETVDLSPSELIVTRVHASGREERYVFNPYWTRVHLAQGRDGRTDLRLHLHGKELSFGRFLTDEERQDFAHALRDALIASRGGVRI